MLVVSAMLLCTVEEFLTKNGELTWKKPSSQSGEVEVGQQGELLSANPFIINRLP